MQLVQLVNLTWIQVHILCKVLHKILIVPVNERFICLGEVVIDIQLNEILIRYCCIVVASSTSYPGLPPRLHRSCGMLVTHETKSES